MRRIAILVVAAIVIVAIGVFGWRAFNLGPLAFAGSSTVALADYRKANPTGVPASLAKADIVKRGEYLAKAADCMVCHTAPGDAAFAGGLVFPAPSGSLYSTNSPTRTPGSAITAIRISSTRCGAVFAKTARGFIRPCRTRHTPS
jgi:mono/diheme cytochrome c family protein